MLVETYERHSKPIPIAGKLPIELIFVLGFLLHFGVMYPGFMTYDSVNQILEAREGVFSDWHPPLMAMIWRLIEKIVPGTAGMLCLQIALIWLGAALVFQTYFKTCCAKLGALAISLLFFLPPMFGISGAILKDMLMWGALLIAFGVAGHIQKSQPQKPLIAGLLLVLTILVLWLAILLRHNAVFATIPVLGFAIFRIFPKDSFWGLIRAAIPAVVIAAVLFSASGELNKRFADRHTQPWVANAAFDVVGIMKRLDDKTTQQMLFTQLSSLLNSAGTIEPLLNSYTPMYWRELFRSKPPTLLLPEHAIGAKLHGFDSFSDEQLNALHTLWMQTIRSEPLLWLRHRLAVSKYVLGLVPDSTWSPVIMGKETPLDLEQEYGKFTAPTQLQNTIEAGLSSLINHWYFQPWPYFVISIGVLMIILFRSVTAYIEVICLTSSGLLHELGLLLAAPSPDFRYSHYMIFCTLLSLLMLARPGMKKVTLKPDI